MAKLKIEIGNDWLHIETVPITRKTNSEILNRIPQDKMWRANYLSHIIKSPKMTLWEWGDVPFNTISIIYDCIEDLLTEYDAEFRLLNDTIEKINSKEFDGQELKNLVRQRDFLLESIDIKENGSREIIYSKTIIKAIRANPRSKQSPNSRPHQEIIYIF